MYLLVFISLFVINKQWFIIDNVMSLNLNVISLQKIYTFSFRIICLVMLYLLSKQQSI